MNPKGLAGRARNLGFSPTLAVADLARRLRAEGRDILDLSAGQPDFPSPESVKQAGRRAIDEDKTRYTPNAGIDELREAIARRQCERRGVPCEPRQVLVSPGAKASLYFALQVLVDPGDEVLVPTPYWTSYPEQIRLAGGVPVYVAGDETQGFRLDPERIEAAITPKTKALILNYPSNPTGACYDADDLRPLAEIAVRHGVWIVADEIYSELLYDGRSFTSVASLGAEIAARTVVVDGMSKTYAMTGWRIGYATGPVELIASMSKLQSHVTSNATSIAQWASLAALEMTADELAPRLREFERRRDEVVRAMERLPGVGFHVPEGAFYVFPNVSGCFNDELTCGEDVARYLLERAGVALVPGEAFGSAAHVRLSYAVSVEKIREGMRRIGEALSAL